MPDGNGAGPSQLGPEEDFVSKKGNRSKLVVAAGILVLTVLSLLALLTIVYFSLVTRPGAAVVEALLEGEIVGSAHLESVSATPGGARLGIQGLLLNDIQNKPVLSLGELSVTTGSWLDLVGSRFGEVKASNATLHVRIDENGVNLASFLATKPEEEPSPPKPWEVYKLELENLTVDLKSPTGDATLGPIHAQGHLEGDKDGKASGELRIQAEKLELAPRDPQLVLLLNTLFGEHPTQTLGPIEAVVQWGPTSATVKIIKAAFPGGLVSLEAEIPMDAEGNPRPEDAGRITLVLTRDNQPMARINFQGTGGEQRLDIQVQGIDFPSIAWTSKEPFPGISLKGLEAKGSKSTDTWYADASVTSLAVSGGEAMGIPSVSLDSLKLDLAPDKVAVAVQGLSIPSYASQDLGFSNFKGEFSLKGSPGKAIRVEDVEAWTQGSMIDSVPALLREHWGPFEGSAELHMDRLTTDSAAFPGAFDLKAEGKTDADRHYQGTLTLKPGVPGLLEGQIAGDRKEALISIRLDKLDLGLLLQTIKAPDKAMSVLGGPATGNVELSFAPNKPRLVTLRQCSVRIQLPAAVTVVDIPAPSQVLDLVRSPSPMAFVMLLARGSGELKFGDGTVSIRREEAIP